MNCSEKKEHPTHFLLVAPRCLAEQEAAVFRVERRKRIGSLEGGDGLRQRSEGSFGIVQDSWPERFRKGGPVGFVLPQPRGHCRRVRHAHLGGIQRRPANRLLEHDSASVVEQASPHPPSGSLRRGGTRAA